MPDHDQVSWKNDSVFSAAVIDGTWTKPDIGLFTYGRGFPIEEGNSFKPRAERHHTNVARAGTAGLPKEWLGAIESLSATASLDDEGIRAWAAATSVAFWREGVHSSVSLVQRPLFELLYGASPATKKIGPITLEANQPFQACLTTSPKAVEYLNAWLTGHGKTLTVWVHLVGTWKQVVL